VQLTRQIDATTPANDLLLLLPHV